MNGKATEVPVFHSFGNLHATKQKMCSRLT